MSTQKNNLIQKKSSLSGALHGAVSPASLALDPPRLALIVLETLDAKYHLSTTKDGPYHVKTST